jgi:hypothetical protein
MAKRKSQIETRMRVLELVSQVAAASAHNVNVVWMIEFQEELVERLYRKMTWLLEENLAKEEELPKDGEGGQTAREER